MIWQRVGPKLDTAYERAEAMTQNTISDVQRVGRRREITMKVESTETDELYDVTFLCIFVFSVSWVKIPTNLGPGYAAEISHL